MAIGLFDDGHVDGVVRESDFAEQDAGCRLVLPLPRLWRARDSLNSESVRERVVEAERINSCVRLRAILSATTLLVLDTSSVSG